MRARRAGFLLAAGAALFLAACPQGPTAVKPQAGCMVGGCSGQLCVEATAEPIASTCEFRAAYACYGKHSICERQSDGKCGWTANAALTSCLKSSY